MRPDHATDTLRRSSNQRRPLPNSRVNPRSSLKNPNHQVNFNAPYVAPQYFPGPQSQFAIRNRIRQLIREGHEGSTPFPNQFSSANDPRFIKRPAENATFGHSPSSESFFSDDSADETADENNADYEKRRGDRRGIQSYPPDLNGRGCSLQEAYKITRFTQSPEPPQQQDRRSSKNNRSKKNHKLTKKLSMASAPGPSRASKRGPHSERNRPHPKFNRAHSRPMPPNRKSDLTFQETGRLTLNNHKPYAWPNQTPLTNYPSNRYRIPIRGPPLFDNGFFNNPTMNSAYGPNQFNGLYQTGLSPRRTSLRNSQFIPNSNFTPNDHSIPKVNQPLHDFLQWTENEFKVTQDITQPITQNAISVHQVVGSEEPCTDLKVPLSQVPNLNSKIFQGERIVQGPKGPLVEEFVCTKKGDKVAYACILKKKEELQKEVSKPAEKNETLEDFFGSGWPARVPGNEYELKNSNSRGTFVLSQPSQKELSYKGGDEPHSNLEVRKQESKPGSDKKMVNKGTQSFVSLEPSLKLISESEFSVVEEKTGLKDDILKHFSTDGLKGSDVRDAQHSCTAKGEERSVHHCHATMLDHNVYGARPKASSGSDRRKSVTSIHSVESLSSASQISSDGSFKNMSDINLGGNDCQSASFWGPPKVLNSNTKRDPDSQSGSWGRNRFLTKRPKCLKSNVGPDHEKVCSLYQPQKKKKKRSKFNLISRLRKDGSKV